MKRRNIIVEIDSSEWNVDIPKGKTIIKAICVSDIANEIMKVEAKRITDNADYISIPLEYWDKFKENLNPQSSSKSQKKVYVNPELIDKIAERKNKESSNSRKTQSAKPIIIPYTSHKDMIKDSKRVMRIMKKAD